MLNTVSCRKRLFTLSRQARLPETLDNNPILRANSHFCYTNEDNKTRKAKVNEHDINVKEHDINVTKQTIKLTSVSMLILLILVS